MVWFRGWVLFVIWVCSLRIFEFGFILIEGKFYTFSSTHRNKQSVKVNTTVSLSLSLSLSLSEWRNRVRFKFERAVTIWPLWRPTSLTFPHPILLVTGLLFFLTSQLYSTFTISIFYKTFIFILKKIIIIPILF